MPVMEIKVAEKEEELEIENTEQAENKPASSLDFEEPELVDWEEELGEKEADPQEDEDEEDMDLAQVIEAGTNLAEDPVFEEAKAAGIDDESLAEFQSDPESLKKALALLKKQGNSTQPAEETQEIPVGDTYKSTIDRDAYDPDIVAQFEALEKVSKGLYSKIEQLEAHIQKTSQDDLFTMVDDQYSDLVGEGPTSLLGDKTQLSNRNKVIEQIEVLQAGYKKLGKDVPSPAKLVKLAVETSFSDQLEERVEKKINSKMAKRQNQKTARPTKRTGRKLDPRKQAEKSVAELMRERGLLGSVSETFE